MEILVLDTSVLVKPLLKESGADKVKKILFKKDTFRVSVLVPELFKYEFLNTVTRQKNALTAKKAYNLLTAKQFSLIPIEHDLMDATSRLMQKHPGISFYDASYHALAIAYDATFVTSDKKYYELVKKEGNIKLLDDLKI